MVFSKSAMTLASALAVRFDIKSLAKGDPS